MSSPTIEVCFSPDFLFQHELKGKIVIVADIFRATSCMVTAFAHGVKSIIPVAKVEDCKALQATGLLAAAERDGMKVDGFDLDNSPFSYMDLNIEGKTIAVTTTNGTQAISKSTEADQIVIGSFLNITSVAEYINSRKQNCVILCAGWKGQYNLEDTLFAGALINKVIENFKMEQDAALSALMLYKAAKNEMLNFTQKSAHVKRLAKLNIHKDIEFCLTEDMYQVLPVYTNNELVNVYKHN